jgi:hypothetical protein
MLGLEGVEEVNEVIVLDAEQDVPLVLEHLHFLSCGYRVLPDEFQGAILQIQSATS